MTQPANLELSTRQVAHSPKLNIFGTLSLLALTAAITLASLAGIGALDAYDPRIPLSAAAMVGIGGISLGISRSVRDIGFLDAFHPLVFPLAYSAVSFIAPAWAMMVAGQSFTIFTPGQLAPSTAWILALGLSGMTLGLAIPFKTVTGGNISPPDPQSLIYAGRLMLLMPVVFAAQGVATGSVLTRGVDQTAYGLTSFIASAMTVLVPLGLIAVMSGRKSLKLPGALHFIDWTLALGFIGLLALQGERGTAITVALGILYAYTRNLFSFKTVLLAIGSLLIFATGVSAYRLTVRGGEQAESPLQAILADLSVVTYTTGITAQNINAPSFYHWGETYVVGIIRQLPSPIANRILGPPYDTANYLFRDMLNYNNPDMGLAYSVPAEGYLNFGPLGTFAACLILGAALSWMYSQSNWPALAPVHFAYPIAIMTFPTMLRSDSLGSLKVIFYPLAIAIIVFLVARMAHRRLYGRSRE